MKVWPINETIQCQQLTAEYLQDAVIFMESAFYPHENVCKSVGLADDPDSLIELRDLTMAAAKDGVTVIAVDKSTNKIVGAAFNKLQVRDDPAFENLAKSWKQKKSRGLVQFMADIDNACNLFDHCKIDCLLEFMFLGTLPEYRGKGIGKRLLEISIELGSNLAKGVNVKQSVDGSELPLEPVPKIISSIFTSVVTQKFGRDYGFEIVTEKRFDELEFEGKKFSSVIGNVPSKLTLEYKWL